MRLGIVCDCNHKWIYKHLKFRICEKCGKVESCY